MVMTSTPSEKAALMEDSVIKGRSLWDDARVRLARNKAAVAGLTVLAVLTVIAFIGPLVWIHDPSFIFRDKVQLAPTFADWHVFGTDAQGRDLFARTMVGLRMSLMVGVVATAVSLVIGVIWGATAGFIGGRVDQIMMRIVDVLYSLPFIFFVIILMVVFGRNIILIFVAIGAVEWLTMARIVRGQTIALKNMEFVEAAQAAGVSRFSIIRRHIIPNVLGPVVVYVTLTIPVVILAESFLSFLGLGVQEPLTSLGNLIANGARDMEIAPWTLIFPAATMMLTLFCFNFIGDGLRDAIDPKDR
jgi:oligopeptide transport system permease protein